MDPLFENLTDAIGELTEFSSTYGWCISTSEFSGTFASVSGAHDLDTLKAITDAFLKIGLLPSRCIWNEQDKRFEFICKQYVPPISIPERYK